VLRVAAALAPVADAILILAAVDFYSSMSLYISPPLP
jgi:hypothetical protein